MAIYETPIASPVDFARFTESIAAANARADRAEQAVRDAQNALALVLLSAGEVRVMDAEIESTKGWTIHAEHDIEGRCTVMWVEKSA